MWPSQNNTELFDGVPGPSPWPLRNHGIPLPGFHWRGGGKGALSSSMTLLVGQTGPVAILGCKNYVVPLDDETLLIWHQQHVDAGPTAPVALTVLRPHALPPLPSNLSALYPVVDKRHDALFIADDPSSQTMLSTSIAEEQTGITFPPETQRLEELLILCHSSIAEANPTWLRGDLALMIARPQQSTVRLYPQDWFNAGGLDYMYQGVTRVARNESTGRIHGEGLRISPFVLDESLRRVAK
jgi:hypothetical protein